MVLSCLPTDGVLVDVEMTEQGQGNNLILGSNLFKHFIHQMRNSIELLIRVSEHVCDHTEQNKLLDLLTIVAMALWLIL